MQRVVRSTFLKLSAKVLTGVFLIHPAPETLAQSSLTAEIVEFGLYRHVGQREIVPQKSSRGKVKPSVGRGQVEFDRKTDLISATRGITFGITYRLAGINSNSPVSLKVSWTHPRFRHPKEQEGTTETFPIVLDPKAAAEPKHLTYTLDEDYEIVSGAWVAAVHYQGKVVATKTFHLQND